jgi:soluble lytic murein transglycosylase
MSVGQPGAALGEALDAVTDLASNPLALHALARDLDRRALYGASIHAANRLAATSPAGSTDDAPPCLARLAYPLAFQDLVAGRAAENGLDPYVLLALLRQESWFDPYALSGASAYGLSQITAPTAGDIARGLGRTGFTVEDLFRPRDAIAFGAWYRAQQSGSMGGRTILGLAAYNAGPGTVSRWTGNNRQVDPEVFVAMIDYNETRTYVRSIYEIYNRYRELYGD